MEYVLENESLRLTVDARGAEAVSLISRAIGDELLWCGDGAVWGRHAPILFPYTGKLPGGALKAKGGTYAGGQHGFARDMTHSLVWKTEDLLILELRADGKTRALWPYDFVLRSIFRLEGKTVHHTLLVENPSEEKLQFGIGFHPAFAVPFDAAHRPEDYVFRFDQPESPLCVSALPDGLLNGSSYYLAANTREIPLTADLFDHDSHCMVNLKSRRLGIVEKDTGRNVTCSIEGFPYCLIWSKPTRPYRFVCIEPWHSLTGEAGASQDWESRPAAAILARGQTWQTTLSTTFDR